MGYDNVALGVRLTGAYLDWNSQRQQAIEEGKVMMQQAQNATRTMNYAFMNYEQERRDSFESAVAQLEAIRVNTVGLEGSVDASINEEMEGRTAKLLSRASNAQGLRTMQGVKDNVKRKGNEIDLNKEQQLLYTKSYIEGLHPPKLPSRLNMLLGMSNVYIGNRASGDAVKAFRQSHMVDDNATYNKQALPDIYRRNWSGLNIAPYEQYTNSYLNYHTDYRTYSPNTLKRLRIEKG